MISHLQNKVSEFSKKALESLDEPSRNYYIDLAKKSQKIAQTLHDKAGGLFKQLMGVYEKLQKSNVQQFIANTKSDLSLEKSKIDFESDSFDAYYNVSTIKMLQKLVKDNLNVEENWKKEGLGNLKFAKKAK